MAQHLNIMDLAIVFMLSAMALICVVGSYAAGWLKGYDTCDKEHRWNRWLIRREEQRNIRL